ncbi:MAG TPA: SDR family oxidoreductase [Abditibacteriaceae bacterium]|jgi:NAD(P)-dependent dehydrogenase (short-subunit alcohol dehydrogenase family)
MNTHFPAFDLTSRVALLTGAGRGIGLGIARGLAAAGCAVAIQDIDLNVAGQAADSINENGGRAVALGGDITDLSTVTNLVQQTLNALGGLDILVNNAAIQRQMNWLEVTPEEIERQFRANISAPVLLCQTAVPHFRAQRWGRILNIGSIQGLKGNPGMLPYSMSKGAIQNMTKALARDLAPDGITVNNLAPGFFDTFRNEHEFPSEETKEEKGRKFVPAGRVGEPHDCAGLALLLCSDAGSYITGQTIYLDGGLSIK